MAWLDAVATFALLGLPLCGAWTFARARCDDGRIALAWAAVAWALWAVLVSELLSLGAPHVVGDEPGHLTRWWVVAAWAIPAVWGAVCIPAAWRLLRADLRTLRACARESRWHQAGLVVIAACLTLTLLVALVAAPNNWDSMTYHLARVAMWAQLGGVVDYATHIEPQLYQPPAAEMLIAQSYVVSGGHHLAALVQWFGYVGVIALASVAVGALGGTRSTQLAGAVLAACAPLAILEASSTQNDLVLALWLLLALTFGTLAFATDERSTRWYVAMLLGGSAALALAMLTKGTGSLYGLPCGLLLGVAAIRRLGARRSIATAAAGLIIVVAVNAGHWLRTNDTFGSPVATGLLGDAYQVQGPSPGTIASNLVRNTTNHLDLPSRAWNARVDDGASAIVRALGQDPEDPATTFLQQPFRVGPYGPHEDHAGSLLLLLLGLVSIPLAIMHWRRKIPRSGTTMLWLSVVMLQILLFATFVTWQNWHVRLHLPVTIAAIPFIAVVLGRLRRQAVLVVGCTIAAALAPIYLFGNVTRPLVGEDSILTHSQSHTMFQPRPQLEAPYREVIARLADTDATDVGLVTGIDDWQYPFFALARGTDQKLRFHDVLVTNETRTRAANQSLPDYVICVSCQPFQQNALAADGLTSVPLRASGQRTGRGNDVVSVELWHSG